jgi:hypothetical protein
MEDYNYAIKLNRFMIHTTLANLKKKINVD